MPSTVERFRDVNHQNRSSKFGATAVVVVGVLAFGPWMIAAVGLVRTVDIFRAVHRVLQGSD